MIFILERKHCLEAGESCVWSIKLGERGISDDITHPRAINEHAVSTYLVCSQPWFK